MTRRTAICALGMLALLLLSPAMAAAAVDQTTASFRAIKWWGSRMPGGGELRAYCGLAAFVLTIHALQVPLLLRFRAAPDQVSRRRFLLALAFTEIVPLAWAVANANAAVLAFNLDIQWWLPVGVFTAGCTPALIILIIFIRVLAGPGAHEIEFPWSIEILVHRFLPESVLACALFGGLFGLGLISDAGAEVGIFMVMFGVLPLSLFVFPVLNPKPQRR